MQEKQFIKTKLFKTIINYIACVLEAWVVGGGGHDMQKTTSSRLKPVTLQLQGQCFMYTDFLERCNNANTSQKQHNSQAEKKY